MLRGACGSWGLLLLLELDLQRRTVWHRRLLGGWQACAKEGCRTLAYQCYLKRLHLQLLGTCNDTAPPLFLKAQHMAPYGTTWHHMAPPWCKVQQQ